LSFLLIVSRCAKKSLVTKRPTPEELDDVFLALAHEVRRHIVILLVQTGGELPSGYFAARFSHSWPTTTRHLKVLEDAGILEVRREGRTSAYRLRRKHLVSLLRDWLRHLEPVGPEKKWPATGPRTTQELSNASEKGKKHEQERIDPEDLPRDRRSEQRRPRSRVLRKAPR
jgi:DNA-binding transcriptional ArsR family regulator